MRSTISILIAYVATLKYLNSKVLDFLVNNLLIRSTISILIDYVATLKFKLPFPEGAMTDLVSTNMLEKQALTLNKHFPLEASDNQMQ